MDSNASIYKYKPSHTMMEIEQCCTKAAMALKLNNVDKFVSLILKAKRMCPSHQLIELETVLKAAVDSTDVVKKLLMKADGAMASENLEKAKNMLLCAKVFGPNIAEAAHLHVIEVKLAELEELSSGKSPKDEVRVDIHRKYHDTKINNKENALKCLQSARKAVVLGNLKKAENKLDKAKSFDPEINEEAQYKWIKKAISTGDKTNAKATLENVFIDNDHTGHNSVYTVKIQDHKENKINARKLIASAVQAFNSGNIEKCERQLLKAKRFDASVTNEANFNILFSKLQKEKQKIVKSEGRDLQNAKINVPNTPEKQEKENNKTVLKNIDNTEVGNDRAVNDVAKEKGKLALHCFNTAKVAYRAGEFQFAERMLLEAQRIDIDFNWEPYLLNVQAKIAADMTTESLCSENPIINERIAAQTFYKAKKAYDAGKFREAELLLLQTKTNDPTLQLESYLYAVRDKISANMKSDKIDEESSKISENLVNVALFAIKEKKLNEAKSILAKAEDICPTERGKELLKSIDEVIHLQMVVETSLESSCCEIAGTDSVKTDSDFDSEYSIIDTFEASSSLKANFITNEIVANKDNITHIEETKCTFSLKKQNLMDTEAEKEITDDFYTDKDDTANKVETKNKLKQKEMYVEDTSKVEKEHSTIAEYIKRDNFNTITEGINEMDINSVNYTIFNCFKFPIDSNEIVNAKALECLKKAQVAYSNGLNDKAESLLVKLTRIFDSPQVEASVNAARKIIAETNTKKI